VLRHLARLADSFGARVVAEGVETGAELLAVRAAGIHLAQGYVFGRPRPAGASPAQDAREACCF
jgi:EAL domain-containing protein (putative c-di-GMP-specific phosphodiesterase class I)